MTNLQTQSEQPTQLETILEDQILEDMVCNPRLLPALGSFITTGDSVKLYKSLMNLVEETEVRLLFGDKVPRGFTRKKFKLNIIDKIKICCDFFFYFKLK